MIKYIVVATVAVGVISYWFMKQNAPADVKNKRLETVRNALLTYALSRVCSADFDELNVNYASFDGSKLPSMAGFNMNNALSSYIISKEDLQKGPFYTKQMENKILAIEKYLEKHFDTDDKVDTFLSKFLDVFDKKDAKPISTEEPIDTWNEISHDEQIKPVDEIQPLDVIEPQIVDTSKQQSV